MEMNIRNSYFIPQYGIKELEKGFLVLLRTEYKFETEVRLKIYIWGQYF